jgi:hypothetical protein
MGCVPALRLFPKYVNTFFSKHCLLHFYQLKHALETWAKKPDLGQRVPEPPGSPAEQNRL